MVMMTRFTSAIIVENNHDDDSRGELSLSTFSANVIYLQFDLFGFLLLKLTVAATCECHHIVE